MAELFTTHSDSEDLQVFLASYSLSLVTQIDEEGNSLLHTAVHAERTQVLDTLLKYEKRIKTPATEIANWVNKTTVEGFTALHLSIVKGKIVKSK